MPTDDPGTGDSRGDDPAGDEEPADSLGAAGGDLRADDPAAVAVVEAIRNGDVDGLRRLLDGRPGLARAGVVDGAGTRSSLLHVATDWPGHFPRVADVVAVLVAAGADVNTRLVGPHAETPLHWAASSDDVAALDALLDAGADLEAGGAVIGGGTPLVDAVGFGQWAAAHRLVERGAHTPLREAAALGLVDRVEACFPGPGPGPGPGAGPDVDAVNQAFWYACHGGQRVVARRLLERGADPEWRSPWDGLSGSEAARRSGSDEVADWLAARSVPGEAGPR